MTFPPEAAVITRLKFDGMRATMFNPPSLGLGAGMNASEIVSPSSELAPDRFKDFWR
jgi:hypothetical protein